MLPVAYAPRYPADRRSSRATAPGTTGIIGIGMGGVAGTCRFENGRGHDLDPRTVLDLSSLTGSSTL